MCQYRPYVHICDHGTEDQPSNHLVDVCDNPPLVPGILCDAPKFIHWPLETGLPCWDCHQQRMEALGIAVNIWKYLMILEQLGSCEVKNMIPELRHYYALMQAVHMYGAGENGRHVDTPSNGKRVEGDIMDSPSYWTKGINDLLKLVDMPGLNKTLIPGGVKKGLAQRDSTAGLRDPRRIYEKQPAVNRDGFRYASDGGVMVDMMESVSDEE